MRTQLLSTTTVPASIKLDGYGLNRDEFHLAQQKLFPVDRFCYAGTDEPIWTHRFRPDSDRIRLDGRTPDGFKTVGFLMDGLHAKTHAVVTEGEPVDGTESWFSDVPEMWQFEDYIDRLNHAHRWRNLQRLNAFLVPFRSDVRNINEACGSVIDVGGPKQRASVDGEIASFYASVSWRRTKGENTLVAGLMMLAAAKRCLNIAIEREFSEKIGAETKRQRGTGALLITA